MKIHPSGKILALATVAALAACSPAGEEQNAPANEAATADNAAGGETANAAEATAPTTVAESIAGSADHKTLTQALKAAGLDATLAGPGPYTVFAPADPAFAKLPAGTVETLLKPESKAKLTGILTYHVVPGAVTAEDLAKAAEAAGGTAQIATVGGGNLRIAKGDGDSLVITDAKGGQARMAAGDDLRATNGMIHLVDAVLMPE